MNEVPVVVSIKALPPALCKCGNWANGKVAMPPVTSTVPDIEAPAPHRAVRAQVPMATGIIFRTIRR
jgi:hypothetical protein